MTLWFSLGFGRFVWNAAPAVKHFSLDCVPLTSDPIHLPCKPASNHRNCDKLLETNQLPSDPPPCRSKTQALSFRFLHCRPACCNTSTVLQPTTQTQRRPLFSVLWLFSEGGADVKKQEWNAEKKPSSDGETLNRYKCISCFGCCSAAAGVNSQSKAFHHLRLLWNIKLTILPSIRTNPTEEADDERMESRWQRGRNEGRIIRRRVIEVTVWRQNREFRILAEVMWGKHCHTWRFHKNRSHFVLFFFMCVVRSTDVSVLGSGINLRRWWVMMDGDVDRGPNSREKKSPFLDQGWHKSLWWYLIFV